MIVALGALLGMLGGVVTTAPAIAAGRGDGWQVVKTPQPFTLPGGEDGANDFCRFPVTVTIPVNREYTKLFKTDGTIFTYLVTGSVTASFTNADTGKTITENISGPYKFTVVDNSLVGVAFKGLTLTAIQRDRAQQFGLPPVSVIAGGLTVSVAPDGTYTSVSLQGHVLVDICTALS